MYLSLISLWSTHCPDCLWALGDWIVLRAGGISSGSQSSFYTGPYLCVLFVCLVVVWLYLVISPHKIFALYLGFCCWIPKAKKSTFFKPVDSSALSSSGDIEPTSCCLNGDKCQKVKASIRKIYYLTTVNMLTHHSTGIFLFSQYFEWSLRDKDNKPWCTCTLHWSVDLPLCIQST